LLSIAKLQNLKAIHNPYSEVSPYILVVINRKTTKFESNSQLPLSQSQIAVVVINRKTTKFESNSQPVLAGTGNNGGCYQSQNYKIWKQFTTVLLRKIAKRVLLSIAKLQNLKAIHNSIFTRIYNSTVVINRKTTKFESNSQLANISLCCFMSCYQSQNYKIWKQFTTVTPKT